ncbi:inorganic phosphate transporter [Gammaproteobacteria bacterium]|nr:inorganic phosphate transporter [Gammaproteobacteria bacterium]
MTNLFLDPVFIILIASVIGFVMAFGIGANDVANAMGTSVGSKALTLKQAIIIAAIFEFLGAYLAGGEVTSTIRKGIVDPSIYQNDPNIFIIGMLSASLGAGLWLVLASKRGWPVSTTHSIVGAIIGFVIISKGYTNVSWSTVGSIASSWVTSPLVSGTLAFLLFLSAKKLILDKKNPGQSAIKFIPIYSFYVVFVISLVVAKKGLSNTGLVLNDQEVMLFTFLMSTVAAIVTYILLLRNSMNIRKNGVESAFAILMIISASAMAFAHGSNDVANAIGPLSAVVSTVQSNGVISGESGVRPWVLFVGAIGIVFGLTILGKNVIKTVGENITTLTPSLGFSAELATATTVVAASYIGFPISTTHTLVGGVIGVGLAKGVSHLNIASIGRIITSWLVTIPIGATLCILFYVILRLIFNV